MRFTIAFLVAVLCAIVVCSADSGEKYKVADKDFLHKQKEVLRLFKHVNQPSYYKDHVEIVKHFDFEKYEQHYTKPEVYHHFYNYYKYGYLPRGEIFSVFYEHHLEQAIALFKLFYYAKDFETFYNTAVWARNTFNEGMWLYSFSVAVVHRPDTYGIVLPPIYEVYPHYFYSTEVIQKAYQYKQNYFGDYEHKEHHEGYYIYANYSGHYLNVHPEQSMSYYHEDVGINSFYYYFNIYYPYWMDGEEFHLKADRRGEQYYFVYQQLLARYYLERLSNGWDEIQYFDWEVPFETGYYPSLQYPNGLEFPTRPHFANLKEYFYNYGQRWCWKGRYGYSYSYVHDYERRISDAIDRGYVYTRHGEKVDLYSKDGFNVLGNMIESNPDSPDHYYYGPYQVYARHLLGYSLQPTDQYKVYPSALEHYETSMRDPAFYQFYKKVTLFFQQYKSYLPAYTQKELYFPGVKVSKVEFDRLITYFDYFDADISNAFWVSPEEYEKSSFKVYARQERLNHKPFTYKVHVDSQKDTEAVVKVFIGPKYDAYGRHINISENRMNFVQFDHFKYHLKAGQNTIERNSKDAYFYGKDRTTYEQLYKHAFGAYSGSEQFHLDGQEAYFYFPQRYMLPKGTYDGQEYTFYVFVYPYVPYHGQQKNDQYYYPKVGTGGQYVDGYDLGYPFDRFIKYEEMFVDAPNAYFYDTKIYLRKYEDVHA